MILRDQQLVVRARFVDGSTRDVTRLARYGTTDTAIAGVDDEGRVIKKKRGETTILVSYEHLVAAVRLIFREPVAGLAWVDPAENNFIDRHVFAKLKLLQIPPSELSSDAQFCRRVYLDVIGLVPTPEEVIAFLKDLRTDRRARLIDALLERPEYVDFWALKWADRLGCNQRFTGVKGAISFHRWIRDQIAFNVPLDQFVRTIVTAKGPNFTQPPASFYRRIRNPEDAVETVSQVFMGVRVGCAKCHNHVAERWTQDDYYGMAAFFSQVRYKNGPQNFAQYNKEETVYLVSGADVRQPRTGVVMKPKPLGGDPVQVKGDQDRREMLADWLVSPSNPFFAKAAVNRIWYNLMGRGIVEPVDDFRESNPPASAELLQALADDFVAHGFNVKRTIHLVLNSRVYQLSSQPNPFNADDTRYFSHAAVRMLSAEQMLDSSCLAAGVPEKLFNLPPGTRAAQVPDGELVHPFLKDFGQPARRCVRVRTGIRLYSRTGVADRRRPHTPQQGYCAGQPHWQADQIRCGRHNARGPAVLGHAVALSRVSERGAGRVRTRRQTDRPSPRRRRPPLDPDESPRVLVPALRTHSTLRAPVPLRRATVRHDSLVPKSCRGSHCAWVGASTSMTLSMWQTTSWKSSLVEYSQPITKLFGTILPLALSRLA